MGIQSVKFVVTNATASNWLPGTPTIEHGNINPAKPPVIVPSAQGENLFTAQGNFGIMGDEGSLTYSCGTSPTTDQFTLWWDQRWASSSGPGVRVASSNYAISYQTSFDGASTYTVQVSIASRS
ncbi:hypothetical protein P2318_24695 [Myxococcaceae bacterium GXIMD 01537]